MSIGGRSLAPWISVALLLGATTWAVSHGTLPPAEFTFVNNTEIKSIDPAVVTGQVESRIVSALFEGLVNWDAKTLDPIPGVAQRWELSPDKTEYTFYLRRDARWSDGSPVTAHDFYWSYRRLLDPLTASEYSYQLWYIRNARNYNTGRVAPGDKVEVELNQQPPGVRAFARGIVFKGKLLDIEPKGDGAKGPRMYTVEIGSRKRQFRQGGGGDTEDYKQILLDFDEVAIHVVDAYTLRIGLDQPTPYFLSLTGFFALMPVQPKCVETYGYPAWTKPENLASNGAFRLESRRIRDRLRMVKSETYWNRDHVRLQSIDALAVDTDATALNFYLTGEADWIPRPPAIIVPDLLAQKRDDFTPAIEFATSFLRLNVTRPPLDNPKVRAALAMAIDKTEIVKIATRGGEVPARSFVPPVLSEYTPAHCAPFDPAAARRLLSEAGYPEGRGFPDVSLLFTSDELVAQVVRDQWKRNLGIRIEQKQQEWASFLAMQRQLEYKIARAGWIGDYADANTFLDMFVTDGANNQTGWSSPEFDRLIADAQREPDVKRRAELFHQAETILMAELPIIPLYFRMAHNMVRPYVKGFHPNLLDVHPLDALSIDPAVKREHWRLHKR